MYQKIYINPLQAAYLKEWLNNPKGTKFVITTWIAQGLVNIEFDYPQDLIKEIEHAPSQSIKA